MCGGLVLVNHVGGSHGSLLASGSQCSRRQDQSLRWPTLASKGSPTNVKACRLKLAPT